MQNVVYLSLRRNRGAFIKTLLIMNFMTVLLLAVFVQVSARSYSQKVTITERNAPLEKVFREIRKQTGYAFFFDEAWLQQADKVTLAVRQASLKEALDACFENQPLTYAIVGTTVVIRPKSPNPYAIGEEDFLSVRARIGGKVTDDKGNPLSGASVRLQGSDKGTTTDADGVFSLEVPDDAVLVISFIGYDTRTLPVKGRKVFNITLPQSSRGLNDVIVVGYGTEKKVDLTGSVDQIGGEVLQNRPIQNMSTGLQGVVPGLNITTATGGNAGTLTGGAPGAAKSINIRGYTGVTNNGGSNSSGPLILVDGIPLSNINSINPADVESISVLKDEASTVIYGSRAPNGVILITTRLGKKNQPLRLNYSASVDFGHPIHIPQTMSSYNFANAMNEGKVNAGNPVLFNAAWFDSLALRLANPSLPQAALGTAPDTWAPEASWANNHWFKILLKNQEISEHQNVSFDGGSGKFTYFVGLGYTQSNGIFNFTTDDYKRYNLRTNVATDVTSWFKVALRMSYSQESTATPSVATAAAPSNWMHQMARFWPVMPIHGNNGGWMNDGQVTISQVVNGGPITTSTNDSWITPEITITPLKGWEIKANYSYNYNTVSDLSVWLPVPNSTPNNPAVYNSNPSTVQKSNTLNNYYNYSLMTSYDRKVKGHDFKLLIGYNQEQQSSNPLSASNNSLYNFTQPSLSLAYGTTTLSASDAGAYSWATIGTFGRFNYNYKDKYLLEVNGRYMGTSLFPVANRYEMFTAYSAGWNIAKENFWQSIHKYVNNFKLRGSYGSSGDMSYFTSGGLYYPYLASLVTKAPAGNAYSFDPTGVARVPSVSAPATLVSNTLTWARPTMLDLGTDINFLRDFSLTADWYQRTTSGLFGPASTYPQVLAPTAPLLNNSTTRTTGYELSATWQHQFGRLSVNTRALLSSYRGVVRSYTGNNTGLISNWYTGEKIGTIWGLKTAGKFQSVQDVASSPSQTAIGSVNDIPGDIKYASLTGGGPITYGANTLQSPGDQKIIGNSTPRYSYGFDLGLTWQSFDFSLLIQGVGRTDFMPGNGNFYFWGYTPTSAQSVGLQSQMDRWSQNHAGGYFGNVNFDGSGKNELPQSGFLQNAAYLRGKNLQVGYTLPDRLGRKAHISRMRLYCSAENLFTIAPKAFKHQYLDPELMSGGEETYPLQRVISFGANITFP